MWQFISSLVAAASPVQPGSGVSPAAVALLQAWSVVLALAVSGITAFLVTYAKTSGKNYATKEDIHNELARLFASEKIKKEVELRRALAEEQRQALQKLISASASLLHSMCWLTWRTKVRGRQDSAAASTYDAEAHRLLPEISTHLALVASYDVKLHDQIGALIDQIFWLDGAIGDSIVECESDHPKGVSRLVMLHDQTTTLERDFRVRLRGILGAHFKEHGLSTR